MSKTFKGDLTKKFSYCNDILSKRKANLSFNFEELVQCKIPLERREIPYFDSSSRAATVVKERHQILNSYVNCYENRNLIP